MGAPRTSSSALSGTGVTMLSLFSWSSSWICDLMERRESDGCAKRNTVVSPCFARRVREVELGFSLDCGGWG